MRHPLFLALLTAVLIVSVARGPTNGGITHIIVRGGQTVTAGNYGPCIRTGGLANTPLGDRGIPSNTGNNVIGIRFIPGHTGKLSAFRTLSAVKNTYLLGLPGSNYGQGTGGTVQVQLQTDDGTTNHFPSGTVLGSYTTPADQAITIYDPYSSGGDLPKITLTSPVSVTAGSIYHLVFKNVMPSLSTTVAAAISAKGVRAVTPASMTGISTALQLAPGAVTTVAAAVTVTGSQAVTPATMIPGNFYSPQGTGGVGIAVGSLLSIDTGANQEYVVVSAVKGTTFTANFTKTHAAGFHVTGVFGKILRIDTGANQENVQVTNLTATTFTANFTRTHRAGFAVTSDVTLNFMSLDNTYNAPPQTPIQPCYSDLQLAVNYQIDGGAWQTSRSLYAVTDPIHDRTPALALYYTDGFSEGKAFSVGSSILDSQANPVSGANWTRDRFIPAKNVTFTKLSINLRRVSGTDPITVKIIDDSAATTVLTLTFPSSAFSTSNNSYATSAAFPAVTLTAGRLYDLQLNCPRTSSYYPSNNVTAINYAAFTPPVDPAVYFTDAQGMQASTNSGKTWSTIDGYSLYTLQWYLTKGR